MSERDLDAENAALAAGTHQPAVDDFGNQYLERKAVARGHGHQCNCKCAYMPCAHRRKEHDGPNGACGRCGCLGFL